MPVPNTNDGILVAISWSVSNKMLPVQNLLVLITLNLFSADILCLRGTWTKYVLI